jgi:hypothetical protein
MTTITVTADVKGGEWTQTHVDRLREIVGAGDIKFTDTELVAVRHGIYLRANRTPNALYFRAELPWLASSKKNIELVQNALLEAARTLEEEENEQQALD